MKNSRKSVEIELHKESKKLFVFFGGLNAGIAMPPFEFYSASRILDENKIFIRDFSQCWYQNGIIDVANDIESMKAFLFKQIEAITPNEVIFVGNSMGGYAAILFSLLLKMGKVIAFSPQTFLSPHLMIKNKDLRWITQKINTYKCSLFKKKIWDLKPLFHESMHNKKEISIFVSNNHRLDQIHAKHISKFSGVTVYEVEYEGHRVVQYLRDLGHLPIIMSGDYSDR